MTGTERCIHLRDKVSPKPRSAFLILLKLTGV